MLGSHCQCTGHFFPPKNLGWSQGPPVFRFLSPLNFGLVPYAAGLIWRHAKQSQSVVPASRVALWYFGLSPRLSPCFSFLNHSHSGFSCVAAGSFFWQVFPRRFVEQLFLHQMHALYLFVISFCRKDLNVRAFHNCSSFFPPSIFGRAHKVVRILIFYELKCNLEDDETCHDVWKCHCLH